MAGRSIVLYEECYPKKKENNHAVHKAFLNSLRSLLPKEVKPIIVTDAGFRAPWFAYILELGWNFVGRLRNKNLVLMDSADHWVLSASYYEQATGKPTCLGRGLLTEEGKVPAHLVLYKGKNKGRHQLNVNKKASNSGKSKRHAKANKEPWLLVSSLSEARDNPVCIVNIYRQRMRIEENIRDTKCAHYGLGLKKSLTQSVERMNILLLIAAIATFGAWLAGLFIKASGKAADFQAHSAKLCPRLYGDKDECVALKFPNDITDGSTLIKMSSEIFRALANQEISPEQARTLVVAIKDHGANIVIGNLNERLARLENIAN